MRRCNNCINDNSVRKIKFDEKGTCSYCKFYKKIEEQLEDEDKLESIFQERIDNIKGKYKYDVAVGISGGKDSIYVLYQLIYKYHLNVISFTLDNGFLTKSAKANIDRLVKNFNIKHEYISFDKEMLQKIYRYSMKRWLVPCIACSYIGYATMINYTSKVDAGMCIHGRTPEQMLRYYGNDVFTKLVDSGLQSIKKIDVNQLYAELLNSIEEKIDKNLKDDIKQILFKDVKENNFREFVSYFLYHKYDEKEIIEFLLKNTSWKPDKDYNHYDCEVHDAVKYIYQCAEGRPHNLPEISVLVRSGKISRQEGLLRIKKAKIDKKPKEEINKLCKFVKINPSKILLKAKVYNLYNKVVKR